MKDVKTDRLVLRELGRRLARYRLNRNLTQDALADEAGVSRPTLSRLEQGSSTTLTNLIRVLRALDLLDHLELLVPEPPVSPIQQLKVHRRQRARGSSRASSHERADKKAWSWGDEDPADEDPPARSRE